MSLNLLPMPRAADLGSTRADWREPDVRIGGDLPPDGYTLRIASGAITIDATDAAGAFYGRATLEQLRRTHAGSVPIGTVVDWPDQAVRGVMLDIARDKVPTLDTLYALVDRLASWKVNQLHLYTEHTFAYREHETVWRDASPITAEEIRAIDEFCRARHIELVPNQNCLGHMDRWLQHDEYRALAFAPDGFVERGQRRKPSTIDPANPAALALVRSLLAELLPNFTSDRVHVGLDEPWELPAERIDDYLAWLAALRALPELAGKEMLVWGDILASRPENIARVPAGVTICEWGYDASTPFAARAEVLAAQSQPFWTCPGTSSWLSILGRTTNMRANCTNAARAAVDFGGRGVLNTDWGDMGHLQYLPISEPGLAFGAATTWCLATNHDLDLGAALSAHCYDDPTNELGPALVRLGDAHRIPSVQLDNVASIVLHLYYPQLDFDRGPLKGFTIDEFEAVLAELDLADASISRSAPRRPDAELVRAELANGIALVRVLARDAIARLRADSSLASIPEPVRRALAAELDPVIAEHDLLWHARNRPGGYPESVHWLTHLHDCYTSGHADRNWPEQ
jgi:hexosaminidase